MRAAVPALIRVLIPALILGVLSACSPSIPDSGVGFDNSSQAQRARDTALTTGQTTGQPMVIPPAALSQETLAPAATSPTASTPAPVAVAGRSSSAGSSDIAAETAAALAAASANSGQAPVQASPSNPPPLPPNQAGISDENDFTAVSGRYSIADDAQRLARNRAQYQVVTPTALPSRSGAGSQPNIVSYALKTSNPRGTRIYSRTGFNLAARSARNCAGYASPDQAQIAFLAAGGPQRDRQALDPDGDGYACAWDPAPFRRAVNN